MKKKWSSARYFKYEVNKIPGVEKTILCFQCGTCTADCPISQFDDFYGPRKLVRMTQLGLARAKAVFERAYLQSPSTLNPNSMTPKTPVSNFKEGTMFLKMNPSEQ